MIPDTPGAVDEDGGVAAYIAATAALERLPLEPAWQPAVEAHFKALRAAARKVTAVPLDDLVEAAAIFEP